MRNLISIQEISNDEINSLFSAADEIFERGGSGRELDGLVIATLFFEPSTRTQLSFASAAARLGAKVIGFNDGSTTSVSKGESLVDTIRVVENYADAIVIRHPSEGSAAQAESVASIPVINAGDGGNEHPTQTLLDLYTIRRRLGRVDGLRVGISGDLSHSRSIHSLSIALARFGANIVWIAPDGLEVPEEIEKFVANTGVETVRAATISEVIGELDVVYVNRLQRERWQNPAEAPQLEVLNAQLVRRGKPNLVVMDPLPRVEEIDSDVDDLPNAAYFEAVNNSVPLRMAILQWCLAGVSPRFRRR